LFFGGKGAKEIMVGKRRERLEADSKRNSGKVQVKLKTCLT